MRFNINDYIKVTLNKKGINIFEEYCRQNHNWVNIFDMVEKINQIYKIKNISTGSGVKKIELTIQCYEFFNIFNSYMNMGCNELPFDTNIEIDKQNLRED